MIQNPLSIRILREENQIFIEKGTEFNYIKEIFLLR